jgi:hypothetical protein
MTSKKQSVAICDRCILEFHEWVKKRPEDATSAAVGEV